jgi:4-amino-4-deoxy-L-arabinose transferase-like glycosyltransferase
MKADSQIPATLTRLLVYALFLLHLLVLAVVIQKSRPWLTGDSERYLLLAGSLAGGTGYGLPNGAGQFEAEAIRMPGYPVFILVLQKLMGQSAAGVGLVIVLVQAALFLAAVWLMWRVAREVFDQWTGLCFLALSAVYPFIAYSAGQISPEMPTVFLVALVFFMLLRPTALRLALAGALVAAATYFRPNLLLLAAVITLACIAAERRLSLKALLPLIVCGALLLPWAIHNYRTFGVFTPTSVVTGAGINLFLGTWQARLSVPSMVKYGMAAEVTPELESSGMLAQVRAVNSEIGVPEALRPVNMGFYPDNLRRREAERLYRAVAVSNMKAWPTTYLLSSLRNMMRMWFSAYLPESFPASLRLMLVAEGVVVLCLGLVGALLALLRGRGRLTVVAAVCALLYFTLTLCWFHTEARYTIPVRLVLLAFAAYALKVLLEVCCAGPKGRARLMSAA